MAFSLSMTATGINKMIYLIWYLFVGAVILISITGFHTLTSTKKDERPLIVSKYYDEWWYQLLSSLLNIAVFVFLFIPCWPILLYIKIKGTYFAPQPAPTFAIVSSDLIERFTIDAVERREMVFDPLNAVPDVPFGHLNQAWKDFIAKLGEGDQLWSFSSVWKLSFGGHELKNGYVIFTNNAIGRHFLTMNKRSQ